MIIPWLRNPGLGGGGESLFFAHCTSFCSALRAASACSKFLKNPVTTGPDHVLCAYQPDGLSSFHSKFPYQCEWLSQVKSNMMLEMQISFLRTSQKNEAYNWVHPHFWTSRSLRIAITWGNPYSQCKSQPVLEVWLWFGEDICPSAVHS